MADFLKHRLPGQKTITTAYGYDRRWQGRNYKQKPFGSVRYQLVAVISLCPLPWGKVFVLNKVYSVVISCFCNDRDCLGNTFPPLILLSPTPRCASYVPIPCKYLGLPQRYTCGRYLLHSTEFNFMVKDAVHERSLLWSHLLVKDCWEQTKSCSCLD